MQLYSILCFEGDHYRHSYEQGFSIRIKQVVRRFFQDFFLHFPSYSSLAPAQENVFHGATGNKDKLKAMQGMQGFQEIFHQECRLKDDDNECTHTLQLITLSGSFEDFRVIYRVSQASVTLKILEIYEGCDFQRNFLASYRFNNRRFGVPCLLTKQGVFENFVK